MNIPTSPFTRSPPARLVEDRSTPSGARRRLRSRELLHRAARRGQAEDLLRKGGLRPRDVMRTKEPVYRGRRPREFEHTDDELIRLMVEHPDLVRRPIVEPETALCLRDHLSGCSSCSTGRCRRSSRAPVLDVFTECPLEGNAQSLSFMTPTPFQPKSWAASRARPASPRRLLRADRDREGADYRNRIWTVAQEIPFAGTHPLALPWWRALAARTRSPTCSRPVRAGRSTSGLTVGSGTHRFSRSLLRSSAPRVEPAHVMAAADCSPATRTRRPPLFRHDRARHPNLGPQRECARWFDLGRGLCRSSGTQPLPGLARPVAADARRLGCSPASLVGRTAGSAARPLCTPGAARELVAHRDSAGGVEMGRPSRPRAEMEGRLRVGGDVVIAIQGTVVL